MPPEHARGVRHTWTFTLGSIVFFIAVCQAMFALQLLAVFGETRDPILAVVVGLMVWATAIQLRWCWFLRAGLGNGIPSVGWTIALVVPAVLAWIVGLFNPWTLFLSAMPLWTAASLIACVVPRALRWWTLGVGAGLVAAPVWIGAALLGDAAAPALAFSTNGPNLIFAIMLPAMLMSCIWWWQIVVELDRHRRSSAQLAVTQERLRFASDLHDIHGHHLQVISLKAELAERLLQSDPETAQANIHDVRLIAKTALEETRSLVAGYRKVSLEVELDNARAVLTASGAQCTLHADHSALDPDTSRALASVVREATTNILRHSQATLVSIELSSSEAETTLIITNNGMYDHDGVARTLADADSAGSGIAGLRERLDKVGGSVHARTTSERFTLRASVPSSKVVSV